MSKTTTSYLFFSAANANQAPEAVDIYLADFDRDRIPVLVTKAAPEFNTATSIGSRFVGRVQDASAQRLTVGNELTKSGESYCATYGVEPNATSLRKWVKTQDTRRDGNHWFEGFNPALRSAEVA
ncbi:MAG: hypothetical protein WC043_02515 [Pseudobdellovibrionaceae bacterium]